MDNGTEYWLNCWVYSGKIKEDKNNYLNPEKNHFCPRAGKGYKVLYRNDRFDYTMNTLMTPVTLHTR